MFHQNPAYEVLFGGTKGPGKTETLLREATRQVENKNYRGVLFRRTFPRLGEIIDRSFKYFPGLGAKYSDKDMQLKLPAWTFNTGSKIAFSHCQHERDKYDHQGREWHFMGFDQVEEFTETQYLFLMAQNRASFPEMQCYVRSTANPGGVGHAWVKKRWIDSLKPFEIKKFKRVADEDIECPKSDPEGSSRSFVPATVFDNPSITKNDPHYINRLKQLPEEDQQALLYGNWDVFKGQFFKMWRRSLHVKSLEINPNFKKFLSLDYGYSNPSSVGWWMIDYDGNLHRYRELYIEGLTYEKLARRIMELTASGESIDYCVADPSIWGDRGHHKEEIQGESGAETLRRVWGNYTALVRGDNNRITGWNRLRTWLENGRISCAPVCKDSIRTIPSLIHDDARPEDVDTTGEDHSGDEWRYAAMSRPEPSVKPIPRSKDSAQPLAIELIHGTEKESEYDKWVN